MINIDVDFSELDGFIDKLTSGYGIDKYISDATEDLAEKLLVLIKQRTPIGETSALISGWGGEIYVTRIANGNEVTLVNNCEYALSVNDGHVSKNQFGGPYIVKHRVKVPTPKQWQVGDATYVFGHFFVEEGIVDIYDKVEEIVLPHLNNWLRWCING